LKGDPAVITALNNVLALEIPHHEDACALQQVLDRFEIKGLFKWIARVRKKSSRRRKNLEGWLADYDASINVATADFLVDAKDELALALQRFLESISRLRASYHAAYRVAEGASPESMSNTIAFALCKWQRSTEKEIIRLEAFSYQIQKVTAPVWMSTKL